MCKKILALIALLMLGSSNSFAATYAYEIHTYGNADSMYAIFNGIAAICQSSEYHVLIAGIMALGGLVLTVKMAMGQGSKLMLPARHLIIISVFMGMLNSKVTVVFNDPVNDLIGNPASVGHLPVSGVPFILAAPAWLVTGVGFNLAKMVDTAYRAISSSPADFTLTGGVPVSMTASLVKDASTYQLTDSYLNASLTNYVVDCVVPEMARNRMSLASIVKSNDIWGVLSNVSNKALLTKYYGVSGAGSDMGYIVPCTSTDGSNPGALQRLTKDLRAVFDNTSSKYTQQFLKGLIPGVSAGVMSTLFQNIAQYNFGSMYNPTPGAMLQQSALMNLFQGPVQRLMALKTGNQTLLEALAKTEATKATENSWLVGASSFNSTFGYIISVLEVIIFGVFPLIFLFVFIPGMASTASKYFLQILLFFSTTFVMLAIVNDSLTWHLSSTFQSVLGNLGGFNLDSRAAISEYSAHTKAAYGFALTLCPMLAWALSSFSAMPLTSAIERFSGSFVGSVSDRLAQGNSSLDNLSYNNVSSNKHNWAQQESLGAMPVTSYLSGTSPATTANLGGSYLTRNNEALMEKYTNSFNSSSGTSSTQNLQGSIGASTNTNYGDNQDIASTDQTNNVENSSIGGQIGGNLSGLSRNIVKGAGAIAASRVGKAAVTGALAIGGGFAVSNAMAETKPEQIQHAEGLFRQAAHNSQLAAQAQSQGNTEEQQGFMAKAESAMGSAISYLKEQASDMSWTDVASLALLAVPFAGEAEMAYIGGRAALAGAQEAAGGLFGRIFSSAAAKEGASLTGNIAEQGAERAAQIMAAEKGGVEGLEAMTAESKAAEAGAALSAEEGAAAASKGGVLGRVSKALGIAAPFLSAFSGNMSTSRTGANIHQASSTVSENISHSAGTKQSSNLSYSQQEEGQKRHSSSTTINTQAMPTIGDDLFAGESFSAAQLRGTQAQKDENYDKKSNIEDKVDTYSSNISKNVSDKITHLRDRNQKFIEEKQKEIHEGGDVFTPSEKNLLSSHNTDSINKEIKNSVNS